MKLSLLDIKKSTNERSFSNAMMLILDENVMVTDLIKSSNMNGIITYYINYNNTYSNYKVSLKVNENKEIISSGCDCLAHEKYGGMCKHLVALAAMSIKYEDSNQYFLEMNQVEGEQTNRVNKIKMTSFIEKFKAINILDHTINLRPILCYKAGYHYGKSADYALKLKIGSGREYIVKDPYYFLKNVLFNRDDSYGKLQFNHNINSFNEESAELLKILLKNNGILTITNEKDLILSPSFLDELFKFYKGKFIDTEFGKEERYLVSLMDYNLEILLENNSLHINDKKLFIIKGYEYYYILKDGFVYRNKKPASSQLQILYDYLLEKESLDINGVEEDFVNQIYPFINKHITIGPEFLEKYPVLDLFIDTYINYDNGNISASNLLYINSKPIEEITDSHLMKIYHAYESQLLYLGFDKADKKYTINNDDQIAHFLNANLDSLKQFGNIYLSEELSKLKIRKLPKISINVRYNVNLLEFEIINEDLTIEEINQILLAYKKKKKYFKLKDNSIIQLDDDAKKFYDLLEEYELDINKLDSIQEKPVNYILKLLNENYPNINIDHKIEEILNDLRNYKNANFVIPGSLFDILRDYQKEAFYWMKTLIKYNFGGILADDMGLGKTLEIISVLMSDEVNKPTMIVCPTSLIYNWCNEFIKWNSKIIAVPIIGNVDTRLDIIKKIKHDEKIVYITSYDTLRRDADFYQIEFRFIITDEAQFIKNQYAKKSNAVKQLKSDINFSLTGTPIENSLADLWSIFDFVMPKYLADYNTFKNRYESLIMAKDEEALTSLVKKVTPFILRRAKKDVLKELPDKLESIYYVKMHDKQQELYDSYYLKTIADLEKQDNKIVILSLLTRLRQICVDPSMFLSNYEGGSAKVDITIDLIKESINSNHKLLVFSQFTSIFSTLEKRLKEEEIKYCIITGETKSFDRIKLVDQFNENDDIKVFLISLKAGGTGLNLTSADIVIHLDPWWNVSAENQATDRAHRIGQTKKVEVIKIICANSIEQRVLELQSAKKDLADSIINDEQDINKLSKEDLKHLFS